MAINQRLDIRGQQTQTMTPQLQQAIEMLQMNNLELTAFVESQLEQNPLLERAEAAEQDGEIADDNNLAALGDNPVEYQFDSTDPDTTSPAETASPPENEWGDDANPIDSTAIERVHTDDAPPLDTDYENYWEGDVGAAKSSGGDINLASWESGGGGANYGFDDDESSIDGKLAEQKSLRAHMLDQIAIDLPDASDKIIAAYLIDMIDDAGYFRGDVDAVAKTLDCTPERVTFTLLRLQQFDPPGVFARSLAECLALQLREKNRLDPMMQKFLANLELLGSHRIPELQKICGCSAEDLKDMIAEIKALNPKPGESFRREDAQTLIPDIYLRQQKGGGWHVELNTETLPRVLINNRYYAQIRKDAESKDDKKYLSEKFQSANWLIKAMHQRAQTIVKVSSEIVRQQEGFFNYGVEYLRPLVRREIAEIIGMHESTISRVTTNKYMATPRGIFELRYFFTASVPSADGKMAHSSESVRHRIKNLIESEPRQKPLSDDKIVLLLRADGIEVARRTVAKYREQMNIPASSDRKRLAALKA